MRTERFEIQLPFAGFYHSVHDAEADRELEYLPENWADTRGDDMPYSLLELFQDAADYGTFRLEYAKAYAEAFCDEYFDGEGGFEALTSPRFYNFETDRIFVTVGRATLAKLWRGVDKDDLSRLAKERHTSRDGFAPFYSSDWRSWGRLSDWDHNQLETLLLAYLESERGAEWDQWAEYTLIEDLGGNGEYHRWLWDGPKADRAWRLFNYLTHDRPNRAAQTMAQWRVAFAKRWSDTPLGGLSTT